MPKSFPINRVLDRTEQAHSTAECRRTEMRIGSKSHCCPETASPYCRFGHLPRVLTLRSPSMGLQRRPMDLSETDPSTDCCCHPRTRRRAARPDGPVLSAANYPETERRS